MKTKNRLLASVLCLLMVVFCVVGLTACGGDDECSHQWGEWTATTNATCTEAGVQERKCSECGETETSAINALGHDWNEATCYTPKTCKTCSATEGTANPHAYTVETVKDEALKSAANCTSAAVYYKSCSCGAISTSDADTFTSGAALEHKDENTDHVCDNNCGKSDMGTHADSATDTDHVCDYGCGATIESCSDAENDDNHACDVCGKVDVSSHNYSDAVCGTPATCSECGATTGSALEHKDENTDHVCDYNCGKNDMGTHADENKDHTCDYGCNIAIGTCEDANKDHACDYGCDKTFGTCEDTNKDHACDYGCDKTFGTCEDTNKDHACDYGCDKTLGTCVDTDKDHDCDYGCDKTFGTCEDTDKDHACDYGCDKTFGTCEDTDKDHDCDYGCNKTFGTCEDTDKDHDCDYGCNKTFGTCEDTDKDHDCDYGCDKALGTCADEDKDHNCDYGCTKTFGEHSDSNTDDDHVCDYGCTEAIEYTATFKVGDTIVDMVKYTVETVSITEPTVPTRIGYTGEWESYSLDEENITVNAVYTAIEYTATFKDGDTVVDAIKFTVETLSIIEPAVPTHVGYIGAWESYTLGTKDITINAVYSLVTYDVTYNNVSGATNTNPATYDVEDQPLVLVDASKDHYTFLGWYSDASFTTKVTEIAVGTTGTVELYAKWEAVEYTATFMDGTSVVETVKFTVESESISEPAVPNRVGYTGVWESYTLGTKNITINAVYTIIEYTATFKASNTVIGTAKFTVESDSITEPAVPNRIGYTGVWESYTLGAENITIDAVYDTVKYNIYFLYDDSQAEYEENVVVKTTYTIEDEFDFAPLVCKTIGYTFDGWFTEKNVGTGTQVTGVTRGSTGDITVYAQFGIKEYSIIYNNVLGATNTNPTYYTVESDDFTIYPLSKEGYTFDGWFIDEQFNTPANLTITKGSNGDITLYAKWTPITYTIEYVTYGGTVAGNPATYIVTDNVTFNNATLSGYVFKGWYTLAEGGRKVTGITAGTTGNIVLYAHWDYISTITFETNGGSTVVAISKVEGASVYAPKAPTKEHYSFAGWYSDSALTKPYTFSIQPSEDITLYAKWTPIVYEIEYVLNGGTNSQNNVTKYTVEDKIELYAPSKVGYTFIGWFTDAEFTSAVVTEIKVGTSGKITLYAHYSINQYTIGFESNGGTSVSAITQNYATSVTAPEAPAKNGYTFAGWYSNATLTTPYSFSVMPAENITLYAKWNLSTYRIIYNLDGGRNNASNPSTYAITSAKITLKAPTKNGYYFAGWYTNAECTEAITEIESGSFGNVELFAKWTLAEYSVTYVIPNKATTSNITTYTIETDLTHLSDAILKGHTFDGWYTDLSYTTAITTLAGGETGNKTIYAKFTANKYTVWLDGNEEASCTVSFNLNGAEGTIANQTVTPTATLKYPTVPTRDGYIFAGWYDNENCTGSLYDFTDIVTKDTVLYAKWIKVENATSISINGTSNISLNGKNEQMLMFVPLVSGNITITSSGSYDTFGVLYNSEMKALAQNDDSAADGANFLIVYNVTAGETYYIGASAFSSTTTGTATVNISGNNTVCDGGYTITASKGTVTYGQSFSLNIPNAREGYKFLGYADESGVMYTDVNGDSIRAWDKDSETILYSVWERTIYTVEFVTVGGTPVETIQLAYGERLDLNRYVTTKSGFSFRGWFLSASDTEPYNASTMPDENIILYAGWTSFSLGSVKYNKDKVAISVNDTINADLFGIICLDTNGNFAKVELEEGGIEGNFAAGETITLYFKITSNGKSKALTIKNVKVYGSPSLTYNEAKDSINLSDTLNSTLFEASGVDTFGQSTKINVRVEGTYKAGDIITIIIESVDPANNVTKAFINNVKVYGSPILSYNENKESISVNDTLTASLFNAVATDSFGMPLTVTVSNYSGTIAVGNTVTLQITATDSKGNSTSVYQVVKVYGAPTFSEISKSEFKVNDTINPESLGLTSYDTFGKELAITLTIKNGVQTAGNIMTWTATAIDEAGNVASKDFNVKIYGAPVISYDCEAIKSSKDISLTFDFNDAGYTLPVTQVILAGDEIEYPTIPMRDGYVFRGWFVDGGCTVPFDFSQNITKNTTVYAGWQAMVTTTYHSRHHIDVIENNNSSSSVYSYSTKGTSSSYYTYTYFTAYTAGTYKVYYKNSSSSTNYGTYIYIYNATQGKVIKSNSTVNSTSYSSVSITANAGDVIYVRTYAYNESYSATFYMYVTGANAPSVGGIAEATNDYSANVINAIAKDSFGQELQVSVSLCDGVLAGGNTVIYTITATDHLGNTNSINTLPIKVYDVSDIQLIYYGTATDKINVNSKGEEFEASAIDSFGDSCELRLVAVENYKIIAGNVVSLYIVATDAAGNEKWSDVIANIKVYDTPTVTLKQDNRIVYEDTNIRYLFTATDSFGEELYHSISITGEQKVGNIITVTVTATDDNQNTVQKQYTFGVQPAEKPLVELYYNGELWDVLFVESGSNYTLPTPTLSNGYEAVGWLDASGNLYTSETGTGLINLSGTTQLYYGVYKSGYTPIYTADQLKNISMDGKYCLATDINLKGIEWTPLGTEDAPFTGEFDGNGHVISNFNITVAAKYLGLFGYNTGRLKNIGLANYTLDIQFTSSMCANGTYAGSLVGYNKNGMITNCYSTSPVKAVNTYNKGTIYIGGLIGYNNTGTISNCYSTGNVTATNGYSGSYSGSGGNYAGGLIAYNTGTVVSCYATGNVVSTSIKYTTRAGGLIGFNDNTVIKCFAVGNVTSTSTNGYSGGGSLFARTVNGSFKIENCYYYEGQTLTVSGSSSTTFIDGKSTSLSNLQSAAWIQRNLWITEYDLWDFESEFPTINYNSEEKTVIEISSAEQLLKLQGNGLQFNYVLTQDIDLEGREWTPIIFLSGTFDGNGHKISNFKISFTTQYSGFIGYNEGQVKNLILENVTMKITSTYSGVLVGYNVGIVDGCQVQGTINAKNVGGLVGYNKGNIMNCISNVKVTAENPYAGGIAAYNAGNISHCEAKGSVLLDLNGGYYVAYNGGLVGYNIGTIDNCRASGNVSSQDYDLHYVGGLVGYNNGGIITNCAASGNVSLKSNSGTSGSNTSDSCRGYAGGLIGYSVDGTVSGSTASGTITTNTYAGGSGSVSCTGEATIYVGGLIAYNESTTVSDCYATGDINITNRATCSGTATTVDSTSYVYAGGLIGYNANSTVTNCYATGNSVTLGKSESTSTSTSSYTATSVSYNYTGSLIGYNTGKVINCYATGDVDATAESNKQGYAYGGLIANDGGTITNCYKCDEQIITLSSKTRSTKSTSGTTKTISTLMTVSFQTSSLGWSTDNWIFVDSQNPTVKCLDVQK